jgi:type VI secretion system protein ImpG
MNMREYFEAEMRLLHQAAQAFAEAYPEQAGLLNLKTLRDRDPHIERLLEGVAYLTGQIRQRIDNDFPDISEN